MSAHLQINYLEFPAKDIVATQHFFKAVFDWAFIDYGPEYCSVSNANIDCGFYQSDRQMAVEQGSALVVFYSDDLVQTQAKIEQAGGTIKVPTFEFPGGKRFHFCDPNGNEFAVWSN